MFLSWKNACIILIEQRVRCELDNPIAFNIDLSVSYSASYEVGLQHLFGGFVSFLTFFWYSNMHTVKLTREHFGCTWEKHNRRDSTCSKCAAIKLCHAIGHQGVLLYQFVQTKFAAVQHKRFTNSVRKVYYFRLILAMRTVEPSVFLI